MTFIQLQRFKRFMEDTDEPLREKKNTCLLTCASNEDSNNPMHPWLFKVHQVMIQIKLRECAG